MAVVDADASGRLSTDEEQPVRAITRPSRRMRGNMLTERVCVRSERMMVAEAGASVRVCKGKVDMEFLSGY